MRLRNYVTVLQDDFENFESDTKKMTPTVSQHYSGHTEAQKKKKKKINLLDVTENDHDQRHHNIPSISVQYL